MKKYWYINLQEGKVEADYVADDELTQQRIKVKNYFESKPAAENTLHKILTKLERI